MEQTLLACAALLVTVPDKALSLFDSYHGKQVAAKICVIHSVTWAYWWIGGSQDRLMISHLYTVHFWDWCLKCEWTTLKGLALGADRPHHPNPAMALVMLLTMMGHLLSVLSLSMWGGSAQKNIREWLIVTLTNYLICLFSFFFFFVFCLFWAWSSFQGLAAAELVEAAVPENRSVIRGSEVIRPCRHGSYNSCTAAFIWAGPTQDHTAL